MGVPNTHPNGTPTDPNQDRATIRTALAAQQRRIEELERQAAEARGALVTAQTEAAAAREAAATAIEAAVEPEVGQGEELVRFYGFMDMALRKLYFPDASRFKGLVNDSATFALGNVNFYVDATPTEEIRALTEVRLTLYPFGSAGDGFELVDTRVYDQTSATGRNRVSWSGMVLERSWIEWNRYDALRVRVGYFLTPYGIWNVDHGSPVLISSVLPGFWAQEYFPTRQLGLQLLGDFHAGAAQFGYHAWLANGRSPGQIDVDENKHVGGRVFGRLAAPVDLTLGASWFWGQNQEFRRTIGSTDPFRVVASKVVDYTEFGVAADLSLDIGDLRFRAELVSNKETYEPGQRPMVSPVSFQRDRLRWDTYLVGAYRFGDVEPFVFIEHDRRPTAEDDAVTILSVGGILHTLARTQLKLQLYRVVFPDTSGFPEASRSSFTGWDARFVTAF
ncbi:MAG: hypothetical protein OXU20_37380 [Myxococcales bacterium]|nr:hypothetical protein [Myxococcales bacterium]